MCYKNPVPYRSADAQELPTAETGSMAPRRVFLALAGLGVAVHLAVAVAAGNHLTTPWSGGGDIHQYVTLASNLRAGDGFAYAGAPTAFRPPLYPMLLAALMWLAPGYWLALLHGLQFAASIATAWLSGRLASRCFGARAGRAAVVLALFFPTLIYFTGEALTECTAGLLAILFLLLLDDATRTGRAGSLAVVGLVAGVAALERFNAAVLAIVGCAAALGWPVSDSGRSWMWSAVNRFRRLALVAIVSLIVVSPWLVHTEIAFHGQALYSTHSGYAAVEGVLSPTGRAQRSETQQIERVLGWGNWDVETNMPARPQLRDEVALNRQAWRTAAGLWREAGWRLVPIAVGKLGAFWLSTDQLLHLGMVLPRGRLLRRAGVMVYWGILALAIAGWFRLRGPRPDLARVLLLYAALITLLHLPLTMNTRLRSPFFDPLLAALAGGASAAILRRSRYNLRPMTHGDRAGMG